MVASLIAYFFTAFFFFIGIHTFARVGQGMVPLEREGRYILLAFIFIALAWVCAKLGGI